MQQRDTLAAPLSAEIMGQMIDLAQIERNHRVLIPCCGDSDLVLMAARLALSVTALDYDQKVVVGWLPPNAPRNVQAVRADFLMYHHGFGNSGRPLFDRIVMDTPLEKFELPYIRQALGFVKPGGRLVCLADEQAVAPLCGIWPGGRSHAAPGLIKWRDFVIMAGVVHGG